MKNSEKQRIKSIVSSVNKAQNKLYKAQKQIEDALALIETAFLMRDKKLMKAVKKAKRKE
jgi:hypothetical protein